MNPTKTKATLNRRNFLARSGAVVAGSALAGVAIPHVHAAAGDTIYGERIARLNAMAQGVSAT